MQGRLNRADFEAQLITSIVQKHKPISYGFKMKATEFVPLKLLKKFNIIQYPVRR